MKRRDFLKLLGVAVVAPGAVAAAVKAGPERKIVATIIDDSITCYGKHGQNCCCNSCVDDVITDCLPHLYFNGVRVHYQSPLA